MGEPTGVPPLSMVKVTVPSLTVPPGLVTVAVSGTDCAEELKGTETFPAVGGGGRPGVRRGGGWGGGGGKVGSPFYPPWVLIPPPRRTRREHVVAAGDSVCDAHVDRR